MNPLSTPTVTFARAIKSWVQTNPALTQMLRRWYYQWLLRDTGHNFVRQEINGRVWKLAPRFALHANLYEPQVGQWLQDWLRPGDVFWDVGANVGLIAIAAATLVQPAGHVLAIEPAPGNLRDLQRHVELNNVAETVRIIRAAVCDRHGGNVSLSLLGEDGNSCSNSLMFSGTTVAASPKTSQSMDVPAISLDGLWQERGQVPTVIKIDVEGAEWLVLQGATTLLQQKNAPILILAVHPFWLAHPDEVVAIQTHLEALGYSLQDGQGHRPERLGYGEYSRFG
ncbi:MAG TPA: hypothetical protein DCQ32_01335 [Cyanobacteria bacterium UBA8156]|nr:hypothetical protein [Cyanobacteria bacterium UBA8156]